MSKVMVFNFETMQYEQVSEAEGKEWVGLIESMNTDYAAQHRVQVDVLITCAHCGNYHSVYIPCPSVAAQDAHR